MGKWVLKLASRGWSRQYEAGPKIMLNGYLDLTVSTIGSCEIKSQLLDLVLGLSPTFSIVNQVVS